ncbi:hypothetical protein [Pseudomonas putida]|uniref:hypothetical protein n=1 Tax=Pseudomonas putida TaxID=303 RepID=UPI003906BF1C
MLVELKVRRQNLKQVRSRKLSGMIPHDALRFTRWVAGFSIATVILGVALALYVLQSPTSSPVKFSGVLALGVLWLTNLITLLMNAVYWFIRRWPKWLLVMIVAQGAVAVIGLLPMF